MAPNISPAPRAATAKQPKRTGRAHTVIDIPKEGNRIWGDDVPMPWREAAVQSGIPERSFWGLIERSEIDTQMVGKRLMVLPSVVRTYLKRGMKKAK